MADERMADVKLRLTSLAKTLEEKHEAWDREVVALGERLAARQEVKAAAAADWEEAAWAADSRKLQLHACLLLAKERLKASGDVCWEEVLHLLFLKSLEASGDERAEELKEEVAATTACNEAGQAASEGIDDRDWLKAIGLCKFLYPLFEAAIKTFEEFIELHTASLNRLRGLELRAEE